MRAMVLAAGLGTRLRPLTELRAKPLIPLLGLPMIRYNLDLLRQAGVREVMLNLHHRGQDLRQALGSGEGLGLSLHYSEEPTLLGTGGGLRRVLDWLAPRRDSTFLLLNGDTIVDVDLSSAVERHRARGASATLLLHPHPEAGRYGSIGLDSEGRVTGIASLLGPPPDSGLLFAGVHVLGRSVAERLPRQQMSCVLRQGYVPALRDGEPIYGDPCVRFWADLGTPSRYLAGHRALLDDSARLAELRPVPIPGEGIRGLTIRPPVFLAGAPHLDGQAELGPYVVLGRDVRLSDGVRLERCVVWDGVTVDRDRRDGILGTEETWVAVPRSA